MGQQFSLPGKVYLTGAGPGSASLLTLRALEVLGSADIVFHDDLVSEDVLSVIPSRVAVHSVGKRCGLKQVSQEEINNQLIDKARRGLTVVRLKGGDPLIFGRTFEEISALRDAHVAFEIIPGITAATAAAAAAQIPLTERMGASKLVFMSNHCCAEKTKNSFDESVVNDSTVVFYMPGPDLKDLSERLMRSGLGEDLPCLVVSNIARNGQQITRTNLGSISSLKAYVSPTLLIVGATVTFARADEFVADVQTGIAPKRFHVESLRLDETPTHEDMFESKLAL